MEFDKKTHKVNIETMNKMEASAFILFLQSEKLRHLEDVLECERLIQRVAGMYVIELARWG